MMAGDDVHKRLERASVALERLADAGDRLVDALNIMAGIGAEFSEVPLTVPPAAFTVPEGGPTSVEPDYRAPWRRLEIDLGVIARLTQFVETPLSRIPTPSEAILARDVVSVLTALGAPEFKPAPDLVDRPAPFVDEDLNGWKINPGVRPVAPDSMVDVLLDTGRKYTGSAGQFDWPFDSGVRDRIVAWRLL